LVDRALSAALAGALERLAEELPHALPLELPQLLPEELREELNEEEEELKEERPPPPEPRARLSWAGRVSARQSNSASRRGWVRVMETVKDGMCRDMVSVRSFGSETAGVC